MSRRAAADCRQLRRLSTDGNRSGFSEYYPGTQEKGLCNWVVRIQNISSGRTAPAGGPFRSLCLRRSCSPKSVTIYPNSATAVADCLIVGAPGLHSDLKSAMSLFLAFVCLTWFPCRIQVWGAFVSGLITFSCLFNRANHSRASCVKPGVKDFPKRSQGYRESQL